jgi:hypothetical protein
MSEDNTLIDDPVVVGKLNWQGNHLYLGEYFCGSVWPSDGGKYWHSVTVGNCTMPYDDEKSARAGLVDKIKERVAEKTPITSKKISALIKFADDALPIIENCTYDLSLSDKIKVSQIIVDLLVGIGANSDTPIYEAQELLEDILWNME